MLTINARTGAVLATAPAGEYPDGLAYDPVHHHVFVSDESGGVEAVFNAAGHRIATISLGGGPGNVQFDAGTGHIMADVQTRDEIAVVSAESGVVAAFAETATSARPLGLSFVATEAHTLA